jgi:hypothetical protein
MVHSARIKLPLGRAQAPRALEFVSFPRLRECCPEAKGCFPLHREGRLNPDPHKAGPSRWGYAIAFSPISCRRCGVHDGVFRQAFVCHKGGIRVSRTGWRPGRERPGCGPVALSRSMR